MAPEANVAALEARRLGLQETLDGTKSQAERNAMGQFATPSALARDILRYAAANCGRGEKVRFLDPAVGTGAFYSAFRSVFPESRVGAAAGYEIDPHYGVPAVELWGRSGLDLRLEDFTRAQPPAKTAAFDLVICNPPYVRHHHLHIEEKRRLRARVMEASGMDVSGLAGLYCYFLGLSNRWMAPGALAGWLIPSEFMDVNYGAAVKRYLLDRVTLLHIHRFDPNDVQFGDALVSSSVVWFRNETPSNDYGVRMTYGGSLLEPGVERAVPASELRGARKWTRYPTWSADGCEDAPTLRRFFTVKRGLATGNNRFFILPEEEIARRGLPWQVFRPILPGPRHLAEDEVQCDSDGNPRLPRRLFLLDCRLPYEEVSRRHPALWTYLEEGRERGVADRYICRHRTPWYAQESRPAAPFVCTYLGRARKRDRRVFRFIMNRSRATAANVYLMLYPTAAVAKAMECDVTLQGKVWQTLNDIDPDALLGEGRVYGGGLHKLEPRELGNVPSAALGRLFPDAAEGISHGNLFAVGAGGKINGRILGT